MTIEAIVTPATGLVGSTGTWTVSVTVLQRVDSGSILRVQLPESWHFFEMNTAKPIHSIDETALNYVTSYCSNNDVVLNTTVEDESLIPTKKYRVGIDGYAGRYVAVTRVEVEEGTLEIGDQIDVIYGDTADGSPGFQTGRYAQGPESVQVELISKPSDLVFTLEGTAAPQLTLTPDAITEVVATIPSNVQPNTSDAIRMAFVDRFGNENTSYNGNVSIEVVTGEAEVAETVAVDSATGKGMAIDFVPSGKEAIRFRLTTDEGISALTNPARCAESHTESFWWGDLHSHSERSPDGIGSGAIDYAKRVSHIDFLAKADHCETFQETAFSDLRDDLAMEDSKGDLVTLLGYEAGFGTPSGHHNVYFRSTEGVVFGADRGHVEDLWRELAPYKAMTIPHHGGITWGGQDGKLTGGAYVAVEWQEFATPRRAVEIYSAHGLSEQYDPNGDLSYENLKNDIATSTEGAHYVQDGLKTGALLGIIASSDDHRAQPGRGECGLTAIRTNQLTREILFDAIWERACYGTTGARILLDFIIDGQPMGSVLDKKNSYELEIAVNGTDIIETVEILMGTIGGSEDFEVHSSWSPGSLDFVIAEKFEPGTNGDVAYVRVGQRHPYRNRACMAWSSPIWFGPPPDSAAEAEDETVVKR